MLVTSADRWDIAPGEVSTWTATPDGSGVPESVALSVNQLNHLRGAIGGDRTIWLAATFEVHGPIDHDALQIAFRALVARHSTLQCEIRRTDDQVQAVRHQPDSLSWTRSPVVTTESVSETTGFLSTELDRSCAPLTYPAFMLASVSRPERSTVVCGFDHLHVDAHSIAIVIQEMHALYTGKSVDALSDAGCFVSRVTQWASEPAVPPSDPRVQMWGRVFEDQGYRLPTFPLDLGLESGEVADQRTDRRPLADAQVAADIAETARRAGTSTFGALLSSLARVLHDLGGPERLPLLAPVQIRGPHDQSALGWFTTTVPVWADADLTMMGAHLSKARTMAELPLDQALASLPLPLEWTRRDVFMVSYVDYRRLPGADTVKAINAQHVSASTVADDTQIWISRTDDGLHVRTRYPDTADARSAVGAVLEAWPSTFAALHTVEVGASAG